MKTNAFRGSSVFMSRNLVPPEVFDKLHGALKENGAEVFLCCDPSKNGPNDFHVISSDKHEKFEDLRAKGCNLLGPQCVLTCAKENRPLPKQGFTCCLAMDGLKVLVSGFEADEKVKIEKLVTAMGGMLQNKASSDVSFVIVKNVLAAKYKVNSVLLMLESGYFALCQAPLLSLPLLEWASNNSRKPIVTIQWLFQCWNEHRVVPQDSYRVLPFSGLKICVTGFRAVERKEMENLITQNGGKYSPELDRKCTHLICDAPESDKYKVARRWGHIHIVSRKWFDQSITRKACLNEESYTVRGRSATSKGSLREQSTDNKSIGNSLTGPPSVDDESNFPTVSGFGDLDNETVLSQNNSSTFSDAQVVTKKDEASTLPATSETKLDGCIADDSQSEENDLYLCDCRISLVGFEASEMRKLVMMLRKGGASRYVSLDDKLTHIVVGSPSEIEKKEVRSFAASGVIHVVKRTWIEDCDRQKKEIPVERRHIANDLLLAKGSIYSIKGTMVGVFGSNQSRSSVMIDTRVETTSIGKIRDDKGEPQNNLSKDCSMETTSGLSQKHLRPVVNDRYSGQQEKQCDPAVQSHKSTTSSSVFKGKIFRFSPSFPDERRAEIHDWVDECGGVIVDSQVNQKLHFIIECHGVASRSATDTEATYVSSHWIRSCKEDGCLLDVDSHIIYSPLTCQIPLPGFERFRFCVSQYENKDRLLLRNLCYVLGAKMVEKLTKKVTHLLCKFASGPKYEAACRWGIRSVTSEWIHECARLNKVVSPDSFCPKEATTQDREAGLCTVSQFPTQAVHTISGDNPFESSSQSQYHRYPENQALHGKTRSTISSRCDGSGDDMKQSDSGNKRNHILRGKTGSTISSRCDGSGDQMKQSDFGNKKARLSKDDPKNLLSSVVHLSGSDSNINSTGYKVEDPGEATHVAPDVAAAIEDLLEQTSKINDHKSPERNGCNQSIFASDGAGLSEERSGSHSVTGLSRPWLNRNAQQDTISSPGTASTGLLYGFSETQTDSQVVGYEEDLSGRQMLIDRVRTRSGSLT